MIHEQLKNIYQDMKNLTKENQEVEFRSTSSNLLLARIF